ncbi:MAG: AFG1 family ATPase [Gammaproteobacteria bacterium]|nr:MAG: AFG1 family ATPase [Gammaproteobacteria bacterium]
MTPWDRYQRDLQRSGFSHDPAQERVVAYLQRLYHALLQAPQSRPRFHLLSLLPGRSRQDHSRPVRGLYLWGGVGRGKTYLVDCFYATLPFREKRRVHFHRFMQEVHDALKAHRETVNPLSRVADELSRHCRVLCFDEFHVTDIADAMLLGGLLEALFERGVTLVATSNQPPEELYRDGLQRDRFLPAIALIREHTEVIHVDSPVDYRLRELERAEIYHSPLDAAAREMMRHNFEHLCTEPGTEGTTLEILGRSIPTVRCGEGVVWFDFHALCDGPRGAADYIEIAREFHTVLISDIPVLGEADEDRARRLMTAVDEFYDRNVKLVISAAAPPDRLYRGTRLQEPFQRTVSRLEEMRSHDYLARPHLP